MGNELGHFPEWRRGQAGRLFPTSLPQVEFTREVEEGDEPRSLKHNRRILFQRMAPYPQRKVITFNRYTDDFEFQVNYADMGFLSESDLR